MNHYCTYFDRGFIAQGLTLWRSLQDYDDVAVLWVLALDSETEQEMRACGDPMLRVVTLGELENSNPELSKAKRERTRIEYYFTLSPFLPIWLFEHHDEVQALVYLDADLMFFSSPDPIWAQLNEADSLLCAHDFGPGLRHFERHGRFNVGVLGWRRTAAGLSCLEWWRDRCLEWCFDRLDSGRYADQGYLNEWSKRFEGVVSCNHPGVNLAPWNWSGRSVAIENGNVLVGGEPLVVFHFAALRHLGGDRWNSGQLDYAVMEGPLRQAIYGPYLEHLNAVREARKQNERINRTTFPWERRIWLYLWGAIWRRDEGGQIRSEGGWLPGKTSGRWLARLRREASVQ